MKQVVIESPILKLPFDESRRNRRFTNESITDAIVAACLISSYFMLITPPSNREKNIQTVFDFKWTKDQLKKAFSQITCLRGYVCSEKGAIWPVISR